MSLSDVAESLHIRSTYLQAIEEEDWPVIGAPVYIRGFIRTYARFLGVDPEHAIEGFNATVPSAPPSKQWNGGGGVSVDPDSASKPSLWLWVAVVVALGLVAYVGYGYYQLHSGAGPQKRLPRSRSRKAASRRERSAPGKRDADRRDCGSGASGAPRSEREADAAFLDACHRRREPRS